MSISNENQQNSFSLQEEIFQGPTPIMLSGRIVVGDGDSSRFIPASWNSFTVPDQMKLADISEQSIQAVPVEMHKSTKGMKKSEYQSAYVAEDDVESNGKPQFLKLIIAKSIQNNFIHNLWNRSYLRKLDQLSGYQVQVLDDLQLENETYYQDQRRTLTKLEAIKRFFSYIEVFTPYSQFIFIWGLFQILIYLLIFFWLPYKISFKLESIGEFLGYNETKQILEILFLSILSMDVFVGLNLAFIYKGIIIRNRKRILINYFRQYAFVDLVSLSTITLQFFILTNNGDSNQMLAIQIALCAVFYVLRMTKINKILAQIQEFFNLYGSLNDLVGLLKLTMIIVFIAHICACVWHGIAFYNDGYSWLDAYELRDKGNASKYNTAIYWATMTMTTVGYGDITAKNNLELLINNLTMLIASIVFAYSVNSIGIFVSNMYKGAMEYSRSVTLINTFMSKNKIQFELQTRIRSYLEYIWQEEQNMNDEEVVTLISKLSSNLQEELQYQLRGNILSSCKVMIKTFSQKMIKSLLGQMEEQSFSPEERIITINQTDDSSLYIITKGEVEIIFEGLNSLNEKTKRNSLKFLSQGDYFGELGFFTGQSRKATAISRAFTKVFKIKRENFIKILLSYPNDYEKYCQLNHSLMQQDYSVLQVNCYSCQSNNHLIDKCHYVHLCPDKEAILKRELYPFDQKRNKVRGRQERDKELSPWIIQKYVMTKAKELQQELQYLASKGTDFEDLDQHSNMMNDVYEDEVEIDVPSSLNQRSNSRTFSKLSQKQTQLNQIPEVEEDDQKNYSRKVALPRTTLQTAGFGGGMRDSVHVDIIRDDDEQESSDEESEEEKDQVPMHLPIPANKSQEVVRNQQSKITFTRKESAEEIIPRSSTQRSHTYTQKGRNSQTIKRTLTPEKIYPPTQSDLEIRNHARRPTSKKQSNATRTFTRNQGREMTNDVNPTSFMDNQTYNQHTSTTILAQFDKMQAFLYYFPFNNYDSVIKRYTRLQKFFGKKRLYPEFSNFSFFFMTIKKGWKLRRLGDKLRGKTFADTMKKPLSKTIQSFKTVKKVINNTTGYGGGGTSPQRLHSFK
ncbi:unnamed protein product (macronuclear) [Paramecium tetraurelia]|uniref:Cyclic nucleotide-binding domain-containing protein n=1 Tax=Paramecium tetraurelia TaxID=5888 RepID=A0BBX7_PARTE|nr:uncharacterized protein GSPATT00000479001 [Paramecium tetraurelia]CAK56044.1 unnamed protein product [Paramecium tetraurelia]|eukprot:XP_001423442.1 hypothetical protein (macronuclear) [Paramecium tetraurelia strain d4-2]